MSTHVELSDREKLWDHLRYDHEVPMLGLSALPTESLMQEHEAQHESDESDSDYR